MKQTQQITHNVSGGALKDINQVKELNITNSDFDILKAEIKVVSNGEKQTLYANMKFKKPDIYLLSIRSQAGIEASRIYINKDTILINDRINKKVYSGSTEYIMNKYGIMVSFLPVILGDLVADKADNEIINCNNGIAELSKISERTKIKYNIDCNRSKIIYVQSEDPIAGNGIMIEFGKFNSDEGIFMARNIRIRDSKSETEINIDIEKIEIADKQVIKFIPGKDYEIVKLK